MAPFPTSEEQFDKDDRISFSKLDSKYIAVQDDGTEFEFDPKSRRWIPIEDEPLDEEEAAVAQLSESASDTQNGNQAKKRKDAPSGERRPTKKVKPPPQPRQNTAVYVTGLPLDTTVDEVHDLFSRKGGVVAEEIDSGKPRIKMYNDEQGNFKGDALVVFFKPQSVEMAIMLLDDTDFRFSASGMSSGKMRVQAADSSYKKTNYDQEGAGVAPQDREKQQKSGRDRQKIIRKTQKLDAKLADWSDDEPSALPGELASRWDKTVILRHMFTLAELEEDPAALLDIKEDIREECAKLGTVTNVVLFDQEPDGIVSVKFQQVEGAEACIQLMNGRSFDGRVVEATTSTGKERFKRSKQSQGDEEDES